MIARSCRPSLRMPQREAEHVRAPVLLVVRQPLAQPVVVGAEAQEEVLRRPPLRRRAVELAARVDQLGRVQRSCRSCRTGRRARRRSRSAGTSPRRSGRAETGPPARSRSAPSTACTGRPAPAASRRSPAPSRCGSACPVAVYRSQLMPEPLPAVQVLRVEAVHDLLRRPALLLGPDRNRRAELVRPRHHQHPVPRHAVIAREDIRRQISPGDLPQMQRPVRVRPGNANQDVFRHETPASDSTQV